MRLTEADQGGVREQLADYITMLQVRNFPFTSLLPKESKPNQGLVQFQVSEYPDVDQQGVLEGLDVQEFDSVERDMLQARRQRFWWNPAVTTEVDENVVAGLAGGEMVSQKKAALILVKTKLEMRCLSNLDSTPSKPKVGQTFRGMFSWQQVAAQTDLPVPVAWRAPTASVYTSTLALLTETAFGDLMESQFTARQSKADLLGICGIKLKRRLSSFGSYMDDVTNTLQVRTVTRAQDNKTLINVVEHLTLDSGDVDLMVSSWLARDIKGATTDYSSRSGLFVDTNLLALAYTRLPRIRDLEDRGGGPRAICDLMASLINKNPKGHAAALISS